MTVAEKAHRTVIVASLWIEALVDGHVIYTFWVTTPESGTLEPR